MKLKTLGLLRKLVGVAVLAVLALTSAQAQAAQGDASTVTEGDVMSGRGGIFDPLG
jgi:hypothetical protein